MRTSAARMIRTEAFFDTNVLLYLTDTDDLRASRSEALLAAGGTISVQVLNEVALVMRRKWRRSWAEVHEFLGGIRANTFLVPITDLTHERGLAYAERFQLAIYDSMIVAAAVLAGCTALYSEDMHDGLVIDGLTIRNPYVGG